MLGSACLELVYCWSPRDGGEAFGNAFFELEWVSFFERDGGEALLVEEGSCESSDSSITCNLVFTFTIGVGNR